MALLAGTRLGAYEVISPLGAGGMGEVWLARDTRLNREVAIKVLPAEVASDASRLRRFEKEARAASALNHANIVTIYEIGSSDSVSYIAMERVEGKTLRELLFGGALPIRKLLPIAAQMADGLAKAHQAGIVHRDLKPENVMVTKDGLVKILDFGLAKLTHPEPDIGGTNLPTETGTSPGMILGTAGYMSPEQAAGQAVDFHSDQFSFGSILYEMATGKRAFQKKTAVDTLSAILNEEPQPIAQLHPAVPPPLRWIVERCLAKDPEGRYASTKDLARELTSVRDHISETAPAKVGQPILASRLRRAFLAGGLVAALTIAAWLLTRLGSWRSPPSQLRFQQMTFGQHAILSARFAPDGESVVYAASVGSSPSELFLARVGSPESRALDIKHADIKSISRSGQMAILLGDNFRRGTLAVVSLGGGAPREMTKDARNADWSADGKQLAVIRVVDGKDRLEFPVGTPLFESPASVTPSQQSLRDCRVSRKQNLIAFRAPGGLSVADFSGKVTKLGAIGGDGLVWSPGGDELWFTEYARGKSELRAITLTGKRRFLASLPGDFVLMDVSASGRVLLERGEEEWKLYGRLAGDEEERDLTWLDATVPSDISRDGRKLLFTEKSPGWTDGEIFIRTGSSPAVRLGQGLSGALSPDGEWATTKPTFGSAEIILLPTGAGQPIRLPNGGLADRVSGTWLPDGKRILYSGRAAEHKSRLYVQDIAGGAPKPITPEGAFLYGVGGGSVSPDGSVVIGHDEDRRAFLYAIDEKMTARPEPVRGIEPGERPIRWSADGRCLFVQGGDDRSTKVFLVDVTSGQRKLWKEFVSPYPSLLPFLVFVTPDGKAWVRSYTRWVSNLHTLEGVK